MIFVLYILSESKIEFYALMMWKQIQENYTTVPYVSMWFSTSEKPGF